LVAMLAEVLILLGQYPRALAEVQRVLDGTETSRDRFFNAELHRLAAGCHLALGHAAAAEAALQQAIGTARAPGGKTLELRAATARGRLWAARGETGRATELLSSICDVLRDAGDTIDLRRADGCLAEWR